MPERLAYEERIESIGDDADLMDVSIATVLDASLPATTVGAPAEVDLAANMRPTAKLTRLPLAAKQRGQEVCR